MIKKKTTKKNLIELQGEMYKFFISNGGFQHAFRLLIGQTEKKKWYLCSRSEIIIRFQADVSAEM